jgi:gamma-resorcylate decarboxylase
MQGKIALEEHFNVSAFDAEVPEYVSRDPEARKDIRRRLFDVHAMRLEDMDAAGISRCLLSLTAPGVQAEPDPERAVSGARQANDALAEIIAANPARYSGFAALPMQDTRAAVTELERCAEELGLSGVLLNGYTNIGDRKTGAYYDHERFLPFWERVESLNIPVYLHPRDPLPSSNGSFAGRPELAGPAWTFTVETATHALRLITSGLFDRFPGLQIVLGHLGETLPFNVWRTENRLARSGVARDFRKPLGDYLRTNFYVTTSGDFDTVAFNASLAVLGPDRIMFSVDYPYESMHEAAEWFDTTPLEKEDRHKIGHENAEKLFGLTAS